MKWIVTWVDHQYEHTYETFDTEAEAREFILREGTENCFELWRGELVEEFR